MLHDHRNADRGLPGESPADRVLRRMLRQFDACSTLVDRLRGGNAPSAREPDVQSKTANSLRSATQASPAQPAPATAAIIIDRASRRPSRLANDAPRDIGTGTEETSPSDRRFADRRQSRTAAVIVHPNSDRTKCTIQDISSSGARIHLPVDSSSVSRAGEYVGPRFKLLMPVENVSFECELAWRSGNRIGVRFISPAQIEPTKPRRKLTPTTGKRETKSFTTALFRR